MWTFYVFCCHTRWMCVFFYSVETETRMIWDAFCFSASMFAGRVWLEREKDREGEGEGSERPVEKDGRETGRQDRACCGFWRSAEQRRRSAAPRTFLWTAVIKLLVTWFHSYLDWLVSQCGFLLPVLSTTASNQFWFEKASALWVWMWINKFLLYIWKYLQRNCKRYMWNHGKQKLHLTCWIYNTPVLYL